MKYILLAIALLVNFQIIAQNQDVDLPSKINFISSKIQQTEKGERLKWMDSLTKVVEFNESYKYDSIVQETINYALELNSLDIATRNTNQYIYYKSEIVRKPDEAIALFTNFLGKEIGLNNDKIKSIFYAEGGYAYFSLYDLENSLKHFKTAKEFAQKGNEDLLGKLSLKIGNIYIEQGVSGDASKELQYAINVFRKQQDTIGIIDAKNSIAILYSQHAFYKEADKERNEILALIHASNNLNKLAFVYFNKAADNREMGNQVDRIKNIKLALKNNSAKGQAILTPYFLYELTIALAENDSLEQAEAYFKEINNEGLEYREGQYKDSYIEALKQLELARGNYNKALLYGKQHLKSKKEGDVYVEIINAEKFLSDVYKKVNDDVSANKHLMNYYQIKDSITGVQNAKNLLLYQTLYETEKRDLEIKNQKSSISLLNLENKTKTQLLIFGSLGLLFLFGGILFYRSSINAKKRELAQQEFSQELIKTQEQERTRIAKDLHDGIGQQITHLKMKAQNTDQTELSGLAHTVLEEVRSISKGLYPIVLEKLGLTDSIEQLLLEVDEETDLFVSVEIDDINTYFNETESLNFYRFIQESVNNVLKHSQAKTLIVNILKQNDSINVLIKDNGRGFEVNEMITQNSLGLKTMEERIRMLKGSFTIKSKKTQGTAILVQIPV